ncbi:low-density lipoprotein receptor-like [Palaemon carinicauda]|uniref:low-density lipoprotein receptor-like n=1 Tax=Palaemon carinicauda TaxID=392227 RepID=UPI0035B5DAF4
MFKISLRACLNKGLIPVVLLTGVYLALGIKSSSVNVSGNQASENIDAHSGSIPFGVGNLTFEGNQLRVKRLANERNNVSLTAPFVCRGFVTPTTVSSVKDETYIYNGCHSDEFQCCNGDCIPSSKRCNGYPECIDQSDEYECTCSPEEFRCQRDGQCIDSRKKCDGRTDCSDGSDKLGCTQDKT